MTGDWRSGRFLRLPREPGNERAGRMSDPAVEGAADPTVRPVRGLTGDDLWKWTAKLTEPVRHRLVRENGTTEHITVPSMLDQLEADLDATGSSSSRSKPGSRAPLNVTALSLLGEIEVVIIDAIVGEELSKRDTLAGMLRALTAHFVSTAEPDVIDWWARLVKGWAGEVQACLPGEDEGATQRPIRGMCCPTCATWTIERVTNGEVYREPALMLVFNNRYVRFALCRACGENWPRGDPLLALADTADEHGLRRIA